MLWKESSVLLAPGSPAFGVCGWLRGWRWSRARACLEWLSESSRERFLEYPEPLALLRRGRRGRSDEHELRLAERGRPGPRSRRLLDRRGA